jgi:hypothetical protein
MELSERIYNTFFIHETYNSFVYKSTEPIYLKFLSIILKKINKG